MTTHKEFGDELLIKELTRQVEELRTDLKEALEEIGRLIAQLRAAEEHINTLP